MRFGCGEVFEDAAARGQFQAEAGEQFGHAPLGPRDGAQAQRGDRLAAAHGQQHVHAFDGGDFFDQAARAGAQAFAAHPHLQGAPQRQRQKADQDVRLHAPGFLVVDGVQAEVAFGGAKGGFGLGELDIPAPELRGILLGAAEGPELAEGLVRKR